VLAYGTDPRQDKGFAPDPAADPEVRMEAVAAAITEAERKIGEIEHWARRLHSRELTRHLQRIVAQARAILDEIEKDPADIRRARRFLVTYLDGTRDVVEKYAAQQEDLAETPLADNFRRVLATIETVFTEQHAVLKRNETLDLEVRIEVLETQLRREGVA
jgi:5-bromo-4-chloroindolyl phosphate hydrolysis protein